ncbi:MAG TPA: shikimate dehydrogenase, partial [Stellaceae bacterium]|nr:shikimate dehydrogenase [Stellaceae bacterium]
MAEAQKFRLAGIMGWPVAHSRSPLLHGYWIKQLRLNGAYVYLPVKPERLTDALKGLPALGFAGCNATIPHKEAAMRLVHRVDPLAKRIGAINTIVVEADGSLSGSNTDVFGFIECLREAAPSWRADAGPVAVMGAG